MKRQHGNITRTRVIVVQGPQQLLNVIAVLRYQQEHEGLSGFDDVLLIGGLSHSRAPQESMYAACMEISKAWTFSAVIDLAQIEKEHHAGIPSLSFRSRVLRKGMRVIPKQIEMLQRIPRTWKVRSALRNMQHRLVPILQRQVFSDAIERLRRAVGSSRVEYVYVCRNTQFVNELALSAFPDAVRICYGDGLGFFSLNNSYGVPAYNHRGFFPIHRACLITPIELEQGHFDLAQLTVVPYRFYVDTLYAVADCYDELRQKAAYFSSLSEGLPITVALTSYLTEYGVVASQEEEVALYRAHILPHITDQELILIKGHPRESYAQSELLARGLRGAGFRCVVMEDSSQIPIELFAPLMPISKVVNYFSTGFVGILMVQLCPVVLGLGTEAYREIVKFSDQTEAIRTEQVMILLARQAFAKKFLPIRFDDEQYAQIELPDLPTLMYPASSEEALTLTLSQRESEPERISPSPSGRGLG